MLNLKVLIDLDPNNAFHWKGIYLTDIGIQYCSRLATGLIPGTLSYLSPERITNGPTGPITTESDIWAVGCIGYELCIAQQLSQSNNRDAINNVAWGGTLDLSHLDARFGDQVKYIIEKCLQRDPAERWTAADLRTYLVELG